MKLTKKDLVLASVVIVAGNLATWLLYCGYKLAWVNPVTLLKWPAFLMFVIGVFCLIQRNTIKRIMQKDESTMEDVYWTVLQLSSIYKWVSYIGSMGLGFIANIYIEHYFHTSLLSKQSTGVQFLAACLLLSFASYWAHRLSHTRVLKKIHWLHHTATEFNGITSFRVHPIDSVISGVFMGAPVTVFGIGPEAMLLFSICNVVYQIWVHTEFTVGIPWFNRVLVTPEMHRIHHSPKREDYDTNFGIFSVWDMVFGTYKEPVYNNK